MALETGSVRARATADWADSRQGPTLGRPPSPARGVLRGVWRIFA